MATLNDLVAAEADCRRLEAEVKRLRAILKAAHHTIAVHGKIDHDTELHERIAEAANQQFITATESRP